MRKLTTEEIEQLLEAAEMVVHEDGTVLAGVSQFEELFRLYDLSRNEVDAEGFNHSILVASVGCRVIYGGTNSFFGERAGKVSQVIPTPGGWLYNLLLDDLPGRMANGLTSANFMQVQGDQFRVVPS